MIPTILYRGAGGSARGGDTDRAGGAVQYWWCSGAFSILMNI